jgi:hypothetical protein
MNFHGGTPRLYIKSLVRYVLGKFRNKVLNFELFTILLKILEKIIFRKASGVLRDSFINKDLVIKAIPAPFSKQIKYEDKSTKHGVKRIHDVEVFAL